MTPNQNTLTLKMSQVQVRRSLRQLNIPPPNEELDRCFICLADIMRTEI